MAGVPFVILETDTAGLRAQVLFNGVTVARSDGAAERHAAKLNAWAIAGDNRIAIRLQALSSVDAAPRFKLVLRNAQAGDDTSGDTTLMEYTWDAANQPVGAAWAGVFERSVRLSPVAAWRWLSAPLIPQPGPTDINAIADMLAGLRDALNARAIDTVINLQSMQIGEQAVALGEDPQAMLGRYRAFLTDRMAEPDWSVLPFDRTGLRLETMGDGRIQHGTDSGGGPPVRALGGGGTFAIDPYLAKIAGRWMIVR